jgi:hypothetical protein
VSTPEYPANVLAERVRVLARCIRPHPPAGTAGVPLSTYRLLRCAYVRAAPVRRPPLKAVLNQVPPVVLPQRRVLTQYPRARLSPQPHLVQARTRGASKAATTAPRRHRGSSTQRRARARQPPRARRTTAWWPSPPTLGAARGAPAAHMRTHAGRTHAHQAMCPHAHAGAPLRYARGTHGVLTGTPAAAAATSASTRRLAPASRTARCSAHSPPQVRTRCSRGAHAVLTRYSRATS